jgi:L-iditol 2-dehydrogenase
LAQEVEMRQAGTLPKTMRAVVQHGPEDLRLEELPVPDPAPGQVLVRVRANGICGSDLHFWRHAVYGTGVVLGHEIAGEVAAVGDGVQGLVAGQPGAVYAGGSCGSCSRCSSGLSYYCQEGVGLGTGRGIGGLAEYLVAPATNFLPMPSDTEPASIAFAEPLANGIRCLDHPEVRGADSAVILGCGPIGLVCLVAAKRAGVKRILVVEPRPRRQQAALKLGAERVLHPTDDDVVAQVRREFPHGPEIAVEAVGLADTVQLSTRLVRPRGTVLVMGVCFGDVSMQPLRWMLKELTIRSSLGCDREEHLVAANMIGGGAFDPRPLITRRVSLSQVPETVAALAAGADEIKVVVEHDRG